MDIHVSTNTNIYTSHPVAQTMLYLHCHHMSYYHCTSVFSVCYLLLWVYTSGGSRGKLSIAF